MKFDIETLVIGNALFYFLTFWIYYKKQKSFNIGSFLLLIWALSAASSVYYYYVTNQDYSNISFLPFLYLYVLLVLSFFPFLKFKSTHLLKVSTNNAVPIIALFIVCISWEPMIENLILVIKSFQGDYSSYINDVYQMKAAGFSSVGQEINSDMSWLGRKLNFVNICLKDFIPILLFYQLSVKKQNKFLIYGLIIATINPILHSYAHAGRSSIVTDLMYIIFLFLLFKNTINPRLVKKLIVYGGTIIIGIGFLVIAITVFRYDNTFGQIANNETSVFDWISLYLGEGMLNFNNQMWHIKTTMLGDNSFSLFKDIIGADTFTDNLARRAFWEPRTGISGMIFYTFIGDFFGDFGLIGTIIFVSLVVFLILKYGRFTPIIPLHRIVLISLWYKVCLLGFTYYTFKVSSVSINILVMLLIYIVLYVEHYKNISLKKRIGLIYGNLNSSHNGKKKYGIK